MFRCGKAGGVRQKKSQDRRAALQDALYQNIVDKEELYIFNEIQADLEHAINTRSEGIRALLDIETQLAEEWGRQQQQTQEQLESLNHLHSTLQQQQIRQRNLLGILGELQERRAAIDQKKNQADLDAAIAAAEEQRTVRAAYEAEVGQQLDTLRLHVEDKCRNLETSIQAFLQQQADEATRQQESQRQLQQEIEDMQRLTERDAAVLEAIQAVIHAQHAAATSAKVGSPPRRQKSVPRQPLDQQTGGILEAQPLPAHAPLQQIPSARPSAVPVVGLAARSRYTAESPAFEILGRELDLWLAQTRRNVRSCCRSICGQSAASPLGSEEFFDVFREGELGKLCCCSTGHSQRCRRRCPVCRLLDLSDTVLLP